LETVRPDVNPVATDVYRAKKRSLFFHDATFMMRYPSLWMAKPRLKTM
jgi:hypothetical protein